MAEVTVTVVRHKMFKRSYTKNNLELWQCSCKFEGDSLQASEHYYQYRNNKDDIQVTYG
jgi:hypothetical protein